MTIGKSLKKFQNGAKQSSVAQFVWILELKERKRPPQQKAENMQKMRGKN